MMDCKLPQAQQNGHNLSGAAAVAVAAGAHHHQNYVVPSYSYLSNPNPDPYPTVGHDNSAPSADPGALRPPGVDPFAAHGGGYEGYLAGSYSYIQAATTATAANGGVGLTSYYFGAGGEAHSSYGAIRKAVSTKKTFKDLETKKQKIIQGGAAADSVRVCTVCNVVCNSDTVFALHLAGEKHAMKALGRSSSGLTSICVKPINWTNKVAQLAFKSGIGRGLKKAPNVVKSVYCEVCKIDCNSQEVLNNHKLGKKHMRNLQKLQESITPKPMNAPAMTAGKENAATDKDKVVDEQMERKAFPASKQDLETKKRKVLEGGAAAAAVRVCSLCNVVCNSQKVFGLHVAGQKHLAMVKKQQEATFSYVQSG